jgi:CubicO group peptidase (beta-lactamase class C family)
MNRQLPGRRHPAAWLAILALAALPALAADTLAPLDLRGLLSVEDDVTRHLPGYPAHGQKITIDHLLTHTSGIPSYTGLLEWMPKVREDLKVEQLIAMFKDKPRAGDLQAAGHDPLLLRPQHGARAGQGRGI